MIKCKFLSSFFMWVCCTQWQKFENRLGLKFCCHKPAMIYPLYRSCLLINCIMYSTYQFQNNSCLNFVWTSRMWSAQYLTNYQKQFGEISTWLAKSCVQHDLNVVPREMSEDVLTTTLWGLWRNWKLNTHKFKPSAISGNFRPRILRF